MNLPFTNEQLYPSAAYVRIPLWFGLVPKAYNPDPETTPAVFLYDECGPDIKPSMEDLIDGRLDSMLLNADIEFSSPNHMVHYLDYPALLVLVADYCDEYVDSLPPYFGSCCTFYGVPVADLTEDQLRKLALWLYDQLGGTECE